MENQEHSRKQHPVLLAIGLNIGLLLLFYLLFEPTAKSDDYDIMNLLYGGYTGEYSPFILYSNPLYGYFLCGLLRLFPSIPWYFVVQILLMLWGLIETSVIFLKKTKIPWWLLALVLGYVYYECFVRITFSKTAGLLLVSGFLLLFHLILERGRLTPRYLEGIGLIAFGILIRSSLFLMVLEIFAGGLLVVLFKGWKEKSFDKAFLLKLARFAGAGLLLIGISFALGKIGSAIYDTDELWKDYRSNNSARGQLYDYGIPDYQLYRTQYEKLGITYTDCRMFFSANFIDDDVLTPDVMQKIRSFANHSRQIGLKEQGWEATHNLVTWLFENTMFYFFVCCAILLFYTEWKRNVLPAIFLIFAACLVSYFYLYLQGRTQHHVDAVIFLAGSFLAIYFCDFSEKKKALAMTPVVIFLGIFFVQSFESQLRSSSYYGTAYGTIDSQKKQYAMTKEQLDLLVDDSEHLYIFNVNDTNRNYAAFTIWEIIPPNYYHNLFRPNGSWPTRKTILADFQVSHPFIEIVNSNTIYYYASFDAQNDADIVWNYIRERTGEDVLREAVKSTGQGVIYRFYTDDFSMNQEIQNASSDIVSDISLDFEEGTGMLVVQGYAYEEGTDSFAQNIYVKVQDLSRKTEHTYMTIQSLNTEYAGYDKYSGKYSAFKKQLSIGDYDPDSVIVTVLLENANGLFEIPID